MNRRKYYIGPGAASLLLVVVVVSMSVLGLLALMSARGDARLAERSRTYAAAEYESARRAEEALAELDALLMDCARLASDDAGYLSLASASLPEGMALSGRTIAWTEDSGEGRALSCAVELAPLGEFPRCAWVEHRYIVEEESFDF